MTRLSKMPSQLMIWLIITGFASVYGNQCDTTAAKACYEDLVYYETLIFPLYGHNKDKLDDNCGNINMSVDCINSYYEKCHETAACDEECDALTKSISSFLRVTGLIQLSNGLCRKESALRQTYLENVDCLEKNADRYAGCHNMSQESNHYMHNNGANSVEASCCYISWYRDCFTNATKDNCGTNATVFVSFAVQTLLGDISDSLCEEMRIPCATPPLPPEFTVDDEMDKDKSEGDMDKDKSEGDMDKDKSEGDMDKDKSEGDMDKDKSDGDLDKDKPDETYNDIDNSIDESGSTASTIKPYMAILTVLPHILTMLSKYLL